MKISRAPLVAAIGTGVAAAGCVSVFRWFDLRTSLLPALSVIAAAVLVRLARGLPLTNADQFELDEARNIGNSYIQLSRSLRALVFVVLLTMGWLALSPAGVIALAPTLRHFHIWLPVQAATSASIGVLLSYSAVRMTEIVQKDVALTVLQADLLERSVQRKAAARFEGRIETKSAPIAGKAGFARSVQ